MTALTAGATLAAAEALRGRQQTFTRAQVAYLLALAYDSGRTAAHREDIAELHCTAEDSGWMRPTHEQRVAQRLADMDAYARRRAEREGRPYRVHPGGPVNFETGEPVRHRLEIAA